MNNLLDESPKNHEIMRHSMLPLNPYHEIVSCYVINGRGEHGHIASRWLRVDKNSYNMFLGRVIHGTFFLVS